jgi:hypothetical protein
MENNKTTKVFVNGLISKDIPDTTPEWILGKLSVKMEDLYLWLRENKGLADENGWINLTILRSKTSGKRYIEVDTWKPKTQEVPVVSAPAPEGKGIDMGEFTGEVDSSSVPF